MWRTKKIYSDLVNDRIKVKEKLLNNIPNWRGLEKIADNWITRICWGFFYVLFYIPVHFDLIDIY